MSYQSRKRGFGKYRPRIVTSDSRENLSPFRLRMSENTPSIRHIDAILASSPGTVDLKATFAGYESSRFADVLY